MPFTALPVVPNASECWLRQIPEDRIVVQHAIVILTPLQSHTWNYATFEKPSSDPQVL